ncbi:WYL domain-containing protein [Clostridium felsineum]|uniref:WYL domain-containing protein n=1 Tax=Clostridium felsineum TaxID=36839 RepID=A0A1S8LI87_9CLOT|nr:WYL domain-containing protein [Clostridium felsineum]URZ05480.1 hypothetical protein CLROS_008060 [Clostridium felsineum]URZ10519.1 hypothetical protein CROST_012290 [Clostridium felsineum]
MFNDFIKHYNIIRDILRDVFLYGCFSREDLEEKRNMSSRKISYEMRRIQQYIESEFIRIDRDGRNKLLALTYDSITNTENFLVNTYMTKSFTKADLILYFNLLMFLNAKNKPCSFREIEDGLINEGIISYDDISSKTVERKLNEMVKKLGILKCDTIKRTKNYSIQDDILKELSLDEIENLIDAVALFKNIILPVTAGYYFEKNLKDYALYERGIEVKEKDYFQYKGLYFHPVIEEDILWKILRAIHRKRYIKLEYRSGKGTNKTSKEQLKPYKIRYDSSCGRFYLVAFLDNNSCVTLRLDRIAEIKISKEVYKDNNFKKLYDKQFKYSWSSVNLSGGKVKEEIKLEIKIDETREKYIIEKIKSEVPNGKITKIEEGIYHLDMIVNDSIEMVPWIRGYLGYIKVIKGRDIINKLTEDWKEMLYSYGAL